MAKRENLFLEKNACNIPLIEDGVGWWSSSALTSVHTFTLIMPRCVKVQIVGPLMLQSAADSQHFSPEH